MPGAVQAVARVRAAGLPTAVVSNQSGIARGIVDAERVAAVNARVDEVFGAFDAWCVCPHGPDDGCDCRKPRPGLVLEAARRLGVAPEDVVVDRRHRCGRRRSRGGGRTGHPRADPGHPA